MTLEIVPDEHTYNRVVKLFGIPSALERGQMSRFRESIATVELQLFTPQKGPPSP